MIDFNVYISYSLGQFSYQISIVNRTDKGYIALSRTDEENGDILSEQEREIAEIVELRQSGMNITAKFLEDLPGTMRREIFRKTM